MLPLSVRNELKWPYTLFKIWLVRVDGGASVFWLLELTSQNSPEVCLPAIYLHTYMELKSLEE